MMVEPAATRAKRLNSDCLDGSYMWISFRVGSSIRRLPRPDRRRWPALRQPGRVHLRGPREGLRVDIFPDLRQLAISNGNVEDPIVSERLIRGLDFPRSDADSEHPVSLRHEFRGRWVCRFYLF